MVLNWNWSTWTPGELKLDSGEHDWLGMTDSETIGLDLSEKWAHFWRNDPILAGMVRNENGLFIVSSDELEMTDILTVLNWPMSLVDSDWLGSGMT